jgi:hypothetical protein
MNNTKNNKKQTSNNKERTEDEKHVDTVDVYCGGYSVLAPRLSSYKPNRSSNSNLRYTMTNLNGQAVQSVGTSVSMTLPTVYGTSNGTRVGDSVKLKALEMNYLFNYETVAVPAPVTGRVMIIQTVSSSTALTVPQILDPGATGLIDVSSLYVPFSRKHAFHVLYDKVVHLNAYGNNAQVFEHVMLDIPIKSITFAPAAATLESGGILQAILISDSASAPHPPIYLTARLWYESG